MTVVISADIITHWERKIFDFILLATSPWAQLAEEAVCDLNEKLTVSLSLKIPESPALFCRNGALAGFSNGLPLHEYQAVDIQRICDREGEQVSRFDRNLIATTPILVPKQAPTDKIILRMTTSIGTTGTTPIEGHMAMGYA
ncbi:hypothetical protein C8J57DRAFT_1252186 [Mycena rebaudengoi]|nr:hypothetical protein C8J57DRAFT_1252186 [Mycena rebaudengoi]